jgi:hypothetical protein
MPDLFTTVPSARQVVQIIRWASSAIGTQPYHEYHQLERWASAIYDNARTQDLERVEQAIDEARVAFAARHFHFVPLCVIQ